MRSSPPLRLTFCDPRQSVPEDGCGKRLISRSQIVGVPGCAAFLIPLQCASLMRHESHNRVGESVSLLETKLCCVVLLLVTAALALQPIAADDFWWQLSRGRIVRGGSFAPSRELSVAENRPEADWLGGLPGFLLYGSLGVSGLMVTKLLVTTAAGFWLFVGSAGKQSLFKLFLVAAGLLAARDAWDPTPLLVDSLGVLLMWTAAVRWCAQPKAGRLIAMAIVMWLWANLAPLCILGVLVAGGVLLSLVPTVLRGNPIRSHAEHVPTQSVGTRGKLLAVALLLGASCGTPRGVATLWDSLRMLIPRLAADAAILESTAWRPLVRSIGEPQTVAFVALSIVTLGLLIASRATLSGIVLFFVTQALAWSSRANLAPAAIWTTLLALEHAHAVEQNTVSTTVLPRPLGPVLNGLGTLGVLLCVGTVAVGRWPGSPGRLGWGIDPRLQAESFRASLEGIPLDGSAHCVGIREAGLLSWFKPDGIRPYDTPSRALLGGRLREHVLLNHELATRWRQQHRRDDGTWGGWWLTLQHRKTKLLIVPASDVQLIHALEPTRWKPLALDAPSLPYGLAGDPLLSPRIVNVLKLREFLQYGPWTYTPPPPSGNEGNVDLWGWLSGRHNVEIDVRQARVLRAMQRHIAALRVLIPALRDGSVPEARREFARNQLELAYQERLTMGRASLFRTLAYLAANTHHDAAPVIEQDLRMPLPEDARAHNLLGPAIAFYVSGDLSAAIRRLPEDDSDALYMRALLTLEAGKTQSAAELLKRLLSGFPNVRESIAGRHVLNSLSD